MSRIADCLTLSDDDLAFLRLTCDLFPNAESPLRYLEDDEREPEAVEVVFASLAERGYLNPQRSGASQPLLDRLTPVSECHARVTFRSAGEQNRSFYAAGTTMVEYRRIGHEHQFGPARGEAALAAELAQSFKPSKAKEPLSVRMSPGDYLVFAVFARDLRAKPAPSDDATNPMSLEEVLAYFDEPESKQVRAPTDESWEASIHALTRLGVLERQGDSHGLKKRWHPLAREIVADRQHVISRFDYLDEQWLVREVSLYPTRDSVFRFGSAPDGAVVIEELLPVALANVVAGVVGTLPNLLNPEAPPTLKHPLLGAGGRLRSHG